ncbi:MAG: discoidin domain-containing protein [Alphaproteobacteria bacterium]|nr:discoidin domain-containing protein [Alphaproteobacteria bacterium]MCB9793504.1 discoidin domain-containing protein [Alphaproteobacteria bacterium]
MRSTALLATLIAASCTPKASYDPVADAGLDQLVAVGQIATLDGSASGDPDGEISAWRWTLIAAPEGSAAVLEDVDDPIVSFLPDLEGTYSFSLQVSDDDGNNSVPDVVNVEARAADLPPVAELEILGDITLGGPLTLDGRGSYDPEGEPLTYSWEVAVAPADSDEQITPLDPESQARFVPTVPGYYVLGLSVNDGQLDSARADVEFTVTDGSSNQGPTADCDGPDVVVVGAEVLVSGAGSYDPEGAPLRYGWSLRVPADSGSVLSATDTPEVSFLADVEGNYVVDLIVNDGELSDSCTLEIRATEEGGNNPPEADAGPNVSTPTGLAGTLDGSGSSDPDGDALTYRWTLTVAPSGSALTDADIVDADTPSPSLTPDVDGDYTLSLEVCDGEPLCDSDTTILTGEPSTGNNPPVADAGSDQTATLGATVEVNAQGSTDPDGDAMSYRWEFLSVPSGSALVSTDIATRYRPRGTFTPDIAGTYSLEVRVCDAEYCDYDDVDVTVTGSTGNTPPVANAGSDQTVNLGDTVQLNGSRSNDPDGDPVTYQWEFLSLPSASALTNSDISGRYRPSPTFVPDVEGSYTLQIRVYDGTDYGFDQVVITVVSGNSGNNAPTADAGADVNGCALTEVTLDGSGSSDPDGDALSYSWSFSALPSGSNLTDSDISGASGASPRFTPDAFGTYTLTLTVDDGQDSDSDSVDVLFDDLDAVLVLHGDETSGTTLSDSGPNGLDASLNNGDWTGGPFFGALAFDSEEATVPYDAALDISSDWTIEWWMRADGNPTGTQAVFMKGNRYTYAVWRTAGLIYFYGRSTNGQYIYLTVNNPSLDGDWHHYAITMDSSYTLYFYEDGVSMATTTSRQPLATSTDDLTLGAYPGFPGTYDFTGAIDEFIIRDVALSASEVADRYLASEQFCTGDSDSDAPTASITSPSNNSSTDLGYVAVEGTASDDSALVSVTVDGVEAYATSENYATWVAFVPVSAGSNTLTVEAEDWAGNVGTNLDSVTVSFADDCYDDYELVLTFDEDTGSGATDEGPYGLNASESGSDRVVGVFGNAALFDGSSYAVVPHDSAISFTGAFTLDLWYARDGASSDYEVLAGKGSLSGFNYAALVYGDYVGCAMMDSSGTLYTALAGGFNDGDFHHLACVYDGADLMAYVDGNLEDTVTPANGALANSDDLYIGGAGGVYGLDGAIDNVRLHAVDLTAAEVADLYVESEPCAVSGNLSLSGSASATAQASTNYSGAKAADGATAEDEYTNQTYWLLPANQVGSVTVDLGAVMGVTRVRWVNTHHGPRFTYATDGYDIHVSPTGAFSGEETLIDTGNGSMETDLRYHQVDLSTPVAGRYVRFTVTSFHSLGGGINELEVYGL